MRRSCRAALTTLSAAAFVVTLATSAHATPQANEFLGEVTDATWQTQVVDRSARQAVIIDFYATWCGPCKQLKPRITAAARQDRWWFLAAVDVDRNKQQANAHNVRFIPDLFAYYGGRRIAHCDAKDPVAWARKTAAQAMGGQRP